MENKFKLTGPFAEELMEEVENNITKRKYGKKELSDSAIPTDYDYVYDSEFSINILRDLFFKYDNIYYGKGIKYFIRKTFLKIFAPALYKQEEFNNAVFSSFEHIVDEINIIHKRVENKI